MSYLLTVEFIRPFRLMNVCDASQFEFFMYELADFIALHRCSCVSFLENHILHRNPTSYHETTNWWCTVLGFGAASLLEALQERK